MARVMCFAPIATRASRVLILGSMPGEASLAAGQYYAHRQNAFWPIVCELLGADPAQPYRARVTALKAAGLALWDVLASCEREGSLDADIRRDSVVTNDFAEFILTHEHLTDVLFNGSLAEASFHHHVSPHVDCTKLRFARLPSTSPANASISRSRKLDAWRKAFADRGIIAAV